MTGSLQNKLRVLVITNGHPTPAALHFYTFIAEQAKALSAKIDINIINPVEILLPIPRHREQLKVARGFPISLRSNGYRIYFSRAYRYFPGLNKYVVDHLMTWSAIYCIKRHRLEFDLIHAHFAHPSGYVAAMISKLFKKPYIITVHGSDILENFIPKRIAQRRRRHRNLALQQAARIICVSQYLKNVVIEMGIASKKVTVIPNGIDTKAFFPATSPNGRTDIIFIGNLIELKGLDLLIRAFHQISKKAWSINLKIIGDGPHKQKLISLATALGIVDRIQFLGPKKNSEIAQVLATARLLCLPSRQEGFGVVLIEALACGVPVVGARTGGIVDIVTSEDIGFLFEPEDVDDLALKLETALQKKWDRNVIRQAGLRYSWDRIADQIIEQYQALLER